MLPLRISGLTLHLGTYGTRAGDVHWRYFQQYLPPLVLAVVVRRTRGVLLTGLRAPMLVLLLINLAWSEPSASVLAGFEPRLLTITGSDDVLGDYGFGPVRSPFLPTWGLRGRVDQQSGWTTTMAMSYGIAVRGTDGNPVPTVTHQVLVGAGPGHTIGSRGHFGAVVGFGTLGHSVGSSVQGGALTYLGPYVEPRGSFRVVDGPGVLELSAAVLAHFPTGKPHSQSLWEEDFRQPVIGGVSFSIHAGPGVAP